MARSDTFQNVNTMVQVIGLFILIFSILGCNVGSSKGMPDEVVLSAGMKIEAINKNGIFSILYIDSHRRKFGWNGNSETIRLNARSKRFPEVSALRSKGDLGLYHAAPGRRYPRLVVREAIVHFDCTEKLYQFLRQGSNLMDWVYTEDGLMIGFNEYPERNQINILLFQLLLNGQKPDGLSGARPESINITRMGF